MLGYLTNKRINKFTLELPNAVDIVVRGIRSGLPLGLPAHRRGEAVEPLRSEFRMVVESQALGLTVPEALAKLFERVPTAEPTSL